MQHPAYRIFTQT